MKKIAALACATTLALVIHSQNAEASPLAGTHTITNGKTAAGQSYKGKVKFAKHGGVFKVAWKTSAGNYGGLALKRGGHVFVGWGAGSAAFGVVVYELGKGGNIGGIWTSRGDNGKTGTERGMGGAAGDFGGTYQIVGTNPAGKGRYKGALSIVKTGDTYQLSWQVGKTVYRGIGIRQGKYLGVGWGMKGFGVVHYRKAGKAGWAGTWALPGMKTLAVEDID